MQLNGVLPFNGHIANNLTFLPTHDMIYGKVDSFSLRYVNREGKKIKVYKILPGSRNELRAKSFVMLLPCP